MTGHPEVGQVWTPCDLGAPIVLWFSLLYLHQYFGLLGLFFFHCPNTVAVRKNALSFAAKWMAPEVVLLRRSLLKGLEALPACADRGLHVESYWGHLLCFARLRNTSILHSLTCGICVYIAICVYTYICKSHKQIGYSEMGGAVKMWAEEIKRGQQNIYDYIEYIGDYWLGGVGEGTVWG